MAYIIINAIIYIIALTVYWKYKRRLDLGFLILAAFTIIAILGIPDYFLLSFLYKRKITIWPYLYLFVVLILFIRPYLKVKKELADKIKVRSRFKLKIIANLVIISTFVYVYIMLPVAIKAIKSGDWNTIRNELYAGELTTFYGNFFERAVLVFNQYFHLISILIFFYFLTIQKYGNTFMLLLGLSCVVPTLLLSISTASRGMTVGLLMEFVSGYLLFKSRLAVSTKKKLITFCAIFLSVIVVYSLAVTISRFGSESSFGKTKLTSDLSLLDYFGQPMLVFNDGVAGMHDYANGKYFFKYILDGLGFSSYNQKELGGSWGTSFFTFVGGFYIDFGPIGTLLLALIFPYYIKKNIQGRVIFFENLFLYFFFYNFFLKGIFVTGESSVISWLFAFLIYFLLKI